VIHVISSWVDLTWNMINESALFLFFGFMLAGIIRALVTPVVLTRLFGKGRFTQIVTASIVGVPLPLCSCSVLPVAAQLHKTGLSREGTVSFLISTPETGVDSIALSVRLLGPVFALVRPIAALISALFSGLAVRLFASNGPAVAAPHIEPSPPTEKKRLLYRLWEGQKYIVKGMFPELAYYLFWGYALAGLAAALIPVDLIQGGVSAPIQYLAAIAVSLPVYVCATSSTPLAAVLISLGIVPGAVLSFLLVGPATNLTALIVQKRILGLKGTVVMTLSVVVSAVVCGIALDLIWGEAIRSSFRSVIDAAGRESPAWYEIVAGIWLILVMVYYTARHYYRKVKKLIQS
jgi:uncharacterized membrane protein YraQ (UPF0718 family)